jgi:hypothetical protein
LIFHLFSAKINKVFRSGTPRPVTSPTHAGQAETLPGVGRCARKTAPTANGRTLTQVLSMMNPESIQSLAEAIKEYYNPYELAELCDPYDIEIVYKGTSPDYLQLIKAVVSNVNSPSHRRFLDELLNDMLARCQELIRISSKEDQLYHEQMLPLFDQFRDILDTRPEPEKISRPSGLSFSTRGEVSSFIGESRTDVTLVDPQMGVVTLDCLRSVSGATRLLTSAAPPAVDENFVKALKALKTKGHRFELRCSDTLNDRYIAFDNRLWALSHSLKEAGSSAISMIEIVDARKVLTDFFERKWVNSKVVSD